MICLDKTFRTVTFTLFALCLVLLYHSSSLSLAVPVYDHSLVPEFAESTSSDLVTRQHDTASVATQSEDNGVVSYKLGDIEYKRDAEIENENGNALWKATRYDGSTHKTTAVVLKFGRR